MGTVAGFAVGLLCRRMEDSLGGKGLELLLMTIDAPFTSEEPPLRGRGTTK